MNSIDVEFIPNVYPGFDKTHSKFYRDEPVLVRNVERFSNFCNIARLHVDDDINMVIVTTWNEWHEGTTIEPAIEYDFEYLQIIKTTLAGYRLLDLEAQISVERGYKFFGENLWDEAKGAYRECPLGSGLENNYWGDDNYLALIFHRDYERFKESERANRIQQFLEKNPPRLELGLRRWCVLSADDYTQYQPYNNWEYADQVALDGIYYARIGNIENAKERFNYLIEKMYSSGFIEDEATLENGHEYYKLALALILAHHLKNEDPEANRYIPILTEKLLKLQRPDGSWLTDDKLPSYPNTETAILLLLALDFYS